MRPRRHGCAGGDRVAAFAPLAVIFDNVHLQHMSELHIAEIPFEGGGIRFRYARKMSADGTRWVREGLFQAFHPNGVLASEGYYLDGKENGQWRDYHANGQAAAEGTYDDGIEAGVWRYWTADGVPDLNR